MYRLVGQVLVEAGSSPVGGLSEEFLEQPKYFATWRLYRVAQVESGDWHFDYLTEGCGDQEIPRMADAIEVGIIVGCDTAVRLQGNPELVAKQWSGPLPPARPKHPANS